MAETPPADTCQLNPDWDKFPNLENVVTPADIESKGNGKYKADYIPWMKVMAMLSQHAPGWQFALREDCDTNGATTPLYRSGDGTAYIKGYFRAPKGSHFDDTPEIVFPVMNHRNDAIKFEEVSARDLSDADRRCRCAAAAAFFRLGWQLWTKDPIENPYREQEPAPAAKAAPVKRSSSNKQSNQPTQAQTSAKTAEPSIQDRVKTDLLPKFAKHNAKDSDGNTINPVVQEWKAEYKKAFKLSPDVANIVPSLITTQDQFDWTNKFLDYSAQPA